MKVQGCPWYPPLIRQENAKPWRDSPGMPELWWGVITVRLALEAGTVHHEGVAHVLLLQRLQARLLVNAVTKRGST